MATNMGKQALDRFRKEIKFESPLYRFDKIYNDCLENGFSIEYPNRKVESIYFDDIFNTNLEDSMNGLLERKKIRLRRYDENTSGQLEVKSKNNQLNEKKISLIENVPDFTNYHKLVEFIKNYCPNEILVPVSIVSYSRIYLKNKKSNVRITLDFKIETIDFQTNIYRELKDIFIIEIKCNLYSQIPKLPLGTQTRFSKYCFSRQNE